VKHAVIASAYFLAGIGCTVGAERVSWQRHHGAHDTLVITMERDRVLKFVDSALARLGWSLDDGGFCDVACEEDGLVVYEGSRPDRVTLRVRITVEESAPGSRVTCTVAGRVVVHGSTCHAPSSGVMEQRFFEAVRRELSDMK